MAHFAEIIDGVVVRVSVVPDEQEHRGSEHLANDLRLGGVWVQTSYNSLGGVHYLPDSAIPSGRSHLRYNYAGIGYTFDPDFGPDGAFIPPQPFPSWTLNPETALWDAPVPMPEEGGPWSWDEATLSWVELT